MSYHKWKVSEILLAIKMRQDSKTWREIGDSLGVRPSSAQKKVKRYCNTTGTPYNDMDKDQRLKIVRNMRSDYAPIAQIAEATKRSVSWVSMICKEHNLPRGCEYDD